MSDGGFESVSSPQNPGSDRPASRGAGATWRLPDPVWNGWDVVRLDRGLPLWRFSGVFAVLFIAQWMIYPTCHPRRYARIRWLPCWASVCVLVDPWIYVCDGEAGARAAGLSGGYPMELAVEYWRGSFGRHRSFVRVARDRTFSSDPKRVPIDSFFKTPTEAWALGILSITCAPLIEEFFFRGFLVSGAGSSFRIADRGFYDRAGLCADSGAQLDVRGGRCW